MTYLKSSNNLQSVLWRTLLNNFDTDIIHRPVAQLTHVNALSRAPEEIPTTMNDPESDASAVYTVITAENEILLYQCADPILKRKGEILNKIVRERTRIEHGEVRD